MTKEERDSITSQVWAFLRMLTFTGGTLIGAFTFAGYMWISTDDSSNTVSITDEGLLTELRVPEIFPQPDFKSQKLADITFVNSDEETPVKKFHETSEPVNSGNVEITNPIANAPTSTKSTSLLNFDAECQQGFVNVAWMTTGPFQQDYILEFSNDNKSFEVYNDQPSHIAEADKNYFLMHVTGAEAEKLYFRLRKGQPGNNTEYSSVVSVNCNQNKATEPHIDVYPAGSGSYRVVIHAVQEDHFKIVMTDMNEFELVADEFDVIAGMNEFTFQSGSLPRGNYNLKVTNGPLVKQKKVSIK